MCNTIFSKFKKLIGRVSFYLPESTDIIIFSETNANRVERIIPAGLSSTIYNLNPIKINLNAKILICFVLNLKYFKFDYCTNSKRGIFYSTLWQLHMIYIKANLDVLNPRAIITIIDNSNKFAWLSENFNAPCIAIQNGFRLAYAADTSVSYYCQHLFCFGQQQLDAYPKLGYRVDNFYPVGSLNLSHNYDPELNNTEPTFDFLIISCWRGNIGFGEDVRDSMNSMRIMDDLFARYLRERTLNAAVILRSERESADWIMPEIGMSEEQYYQSIYGNRITIVDVDFKKQNVYQVMQQSDVIIAGFSSTCILEAFSLGRKVLFVNYCGTDKYHSDFSSEIVFTSDAQDRLAFEKRLDELHGMSKADYKKKHLELMNYYVCSPSVTSVESQVRAGISVILREAQ